MLRLLCAGLACMSHGGKFWGAYLTRGVSMASSSGNSPEPILDLGAAANGNMVTIVGFGSLMSETSGRTTFPDLQNFRFARVSGFRRVFRHPASIFFERGIANLETKEISSLSVEPAPPDVGFVVCAFDVDLRVHSMEGFIAREEEYDLVPCPFTDFGGNTGTGLMCMVSTDETYIEKWGRATYEEKYLAYGVESIWGWGPDSGILPCPVYCRHCVLATSKAGVDPRARDSFLDETYLADRKTTLRQHLAARPEIMDTEPPPSLIGRYSG